MKTQEGFGRVSDSRDDLESSGDQGPGRGAADNTSGGGGGGGGQSWSLVIMMHPVLPHRD